MYRWFRLFFASLLFTLPSYSEASNASWPTSTALCETTAATSFETKIGSLPRYQKVETFGSRSSRNISTTHQLSVASELAGFTSSRFTALPAGPGNVNLQRSNLTMIVSMSSLEKNGPISEWRTPLRSKPGTFETTAFKYLASSTLLETVSESSTVSTQTSHSSKTRLASVASVVVIYETSTDCEALRNGTLSLSLKSSQLPNTTRPIMDSLILKPSSRASLTNSNVSLSIYSTTRPTSMYSTATISSITDQDISTRGESFRKDPSCTNNSIASAHHSMLNIANHSTKTLSSISPATRLPRVSSIESSPSRTNSSVRSFVTALSSTMVNRNSTSSTIFVIGVGEVDASQSRSKITNTPSGLSSSNFSSKLTSNRTTETAQLKTGSFHKKLGPSDNGVSGNLTTYAAPLITIANNTISESTQIASILLSNLNTSSDSASKAGSLPFPSHLLSTSSSQLARNVSVPLKTCEIAPQIQPATTSWTAGACKISSFDDPPSTLKCASSIITPLPVTACACPDGQFYEQMAGGVGPCNDYTSIGVSKFLEPMLTCTDLPSNCIPPSTSISPISTPRPIPDGGRFSVIPVYPSTCNASTITYSSTKPLGTGQIMIDSSIGWGNVSSKWMFQAEAGVKIDSMNNTSNPGTSSFSGNPEASSEKFAKNADGSWTMTVVPNMPSLSLLAITSGGTANTSFPFTVTSVIPCDKPVALHCNNSFSDLTQSQWVAFEVDKFVDMIEKEFQAIKGPNFFGWFLDEYIGDTIKAPCQIDQEGCQPLSDPCTFVKPGPYQSQAFFVVNAMITLSRYIRYAWLAYERSRGDLLSELAAWTTAFIVPQRTQTWMNIAAITASVFGILSVIGFAAGPFMPEAEAIFTPLFVGALSSGLFGINSLLNTAINAANVNGAAVAVEVQFDGYAKADQAMNAYINASEQALIDTNNAYFLHGTNLSQVLQGGLFVANTPIAELTDGDFSGAVTAAADWFDKTMIWGLINQAWKSDDNYIVFLPYGPVKWYSGDTKQFTPQLCRDQFLNNGHWNSTIYGSCDAGPPDHPGFATFMTAQKIEDFNTYNKKSYYEVSYSYQNYNFDADDVFKSSISGYYQYGYNYNATSVPIGQLLTEQNQQPLAGYINQTATSPGIFNVPVCIIDDTSFIPACTITDRGNRGDPCYTSPAQCLKSKWTDPKDPTHVQNFTSFVSNNVVSGLQDAVSYDNLLIL